jgi:hypothetical protein
MIAKTIHYCWFGRGEKSELTIKCINSWKKYCPDFVIKEWNEDNFDINSNEYVMEAYKAKKWAFVTDYVRLYVLYNYGGIYMDTDVEVIKPLDNFLNNHAFSGFESSKEIPTGIMAAEKGNKWIKDLLDEYKNLHFLKKDGSYNTVTNVIRITNLSVKKYDLVPESSLQHLKGNVATMYPFDYFCTKSALTGEINITKNTHTIHHFSGSWLSEDEKKRREFKEQYIKKFGPKKGVIIGYGLYSILHPIKAIVLIINYINQKKY